ncbi:MAG: hypothetical protein ACLUEQ_12400 [Cloacibacillus evryensis]
MSHEAAVGKINQEETEYLMARGLEAGAVADRQRLPLSRHPRPAGVAAQRRRQDDRGIDRRRRDVKAAIRSACCLAASVLYAAGRFSCLACKRHGQAFITSCL